ncbi:TonB-dependent receptor [Sphingomonas sp. MMS12-HWE2-04]|uniref:TonB-dependent receptor n=1 Tax=Sphingomonas sp. MMS12-HWE2-04 TaxID=3234199 RepID=UPI003850E999
MIDFKQLAYARTVSLMAVAAALAVPGVAAAQVADPQAADAQTDSVDGDQGPDIVVSGVRASLERSIAIKRDSTGIVDAISAEDMGKFANTNLAELLQRITGVSIDRVNGEGSTVTVRGFGAQYNLVTLNGRQLATSNIVAVGGDQGGDGAGGFGRSFDFANLASEGVKTLEVYKTGRPQIPSGGIGATINIVGVRPLDQEAGFTGSIGAKASYDNSTDDCIDCGSKVTPEFSGIASWTNADQTFGVTLFGSYQKRNFSFASQANNYWNMPTLTDFLDPSKGFVRANTVINNRPTDPNVLVAVPDDFRYHFSEASRERINGQAVMEFRPTDSLTLTVDGLYAQLRQSERRSSQSNWFSRPFDEVTFDDATNGIATTQYLHETLTGVKDEGFENAYRAQKNRLYDVGGNAKWDLADNFSVTLDGHFGKAESLPDNPNGQTSTTVAFNGNIVSSHGLSWSDDGFPTQTLTINDCYAQTTPTGTPFRNGNCNGVFDAGDLSSAVQRQFASTQTQTIKEGRLDAGWDLGGGSRFDFGGDYRTTETRQTQINTRQVLGDWNNALPPDVAAYAPGLVQQYCLACQFHHNDATADTAGLVAWRAQDTTALYNALYNHYIGITNDGVNHQNNIDGNTDNRVKEDIWAAYGQVTWKGELGGRKTSLVAGVRFESTKVHSVSLQQVPLAVVWQADNDFNVANSADRQEVTGRGSYNNLLPSFDFQIEPLDNVIARLSYSKTISRAPYGSLFASTSAGALNNPTSLGGTATGNQNDPNLKPLDSDNFDISLEWYPHKDVYLSVGFFDKRVHNFIGNTVVQRNLFGLRDPTAGPNATAARGIVTGLGGDITNVNLFTSAAVLQKYAGNVATATAELAANYDAANRTFNSTYIANTIAALDVQPTTGDPLLSFAVNTPINNKDAEIYGVELAGQYFLGNTGLGLAASYTLVRGNIGFDITADPTANQFALVGLSDTANATLIYEKYGISARLAYNWRGKFLSDVNRGAAHNPVYNDPYGQLDLSISYDVTKNISLSFEGINLLEEGTRTYSRDYINTWYEAEGSARYLLGARFRF